jgi:hypothetical protein
VSLEIANKDRSYEWVLSWMAHQSSNRSLKWVRSPNLSVDTVSTPESGSKVMSNIVAGTGTHYFKYCGVWMQVGIVPHAIHQEYSLRLQAFLDAKRAGNKSHEHDVAHAMGDNYYHHFVTRPPLVVVAFVRSATASEQAEGRQTGRKHCLGYRMASFWESSQEASARQRDSRQWHK